MAGKINTSAVMSHFSGRNCTLRQTSNLNGCLLLDSPAILCAKTKELRCELAFAQKGYLGPLQ